MRPCERGEFQRKTAEIEITDQQIAGFPDMRGWATRRTTKQIAAVAIALCGWIAWSALAQAPANPQEAEEVESIFQPAQRSLRQHLTRAKQAIDEQRFGDAVSELGGLLTSPELNRNGEAGGEPQDFFLGTGGGTGPQTSVKTEAQRLLGAMPARGRELYELQFGAEAKLLLEDAVRSGDLEKLNEVTRRYFHTRAGYDATVLLGRLHFDRGRPLAAALCWKRVLDTTVAGARFEPELSVLLASAYLQAGRNDAAVEVLAGLRKRLPDAQVSIGSQPAAPLPASGQELAWLESRFGSPDRAGSADAGTSQWTMYRGNAARNASAVGDLPLRTPRWFAGSAEDQEDERFIADLEQGFIDEEVAAIPALQPLAVGDVVLTRSPERLYALNLQTGKRVWEYPWWDLSDQSSPYAAGDTPRNQGIDERKLQLKQRLWYDAAYGQMSSDGEAVFLIDDLRNTLPATSRWTLMGGRPGLTPQQATNQLVALELRTEGKTRWMVGGETGLDEPKLAGAFFLGSPLPLFGQLYVLAEIKGEIRLVVVDAQTGRQEWSQQIAQVDSQGILDNPQRRLVAASPSFADGIVLCPTSAGAIVAVDMATRSLLWGYQYAPIASLSRNFGMIQPYPGQASKPGDRWSDGTVTVADGAVVLTPPESNKLFCLDLLTGEPKWPPRDRADDLAEMLYVACIRAGQIVLVGRTHITAIRLSDGKSAWAEPIALAADQREMPSGRGLYAEPFYYLPTTTAQLLKVDLNQGKVAQRMRTGVVLGNVISHRDQLVSQGAAGTAAYHQISPLRVQVAASLAKSPSDAWALARQGELLVNDGDIRGAMESLRKAHDIKPDDPEIRGLLVSTFLNALSDDFQKYQELTPLVEPLIDDAAQRCAYLRILASNLQTQGKLVEAWSSLSRLADLMIQEGQKLPSLWEAAESVEAGWSVRPDCWFAARLSALWDAADSELRATIEKEIVQRQDSVLAGSPEGLQRFISLFGTHPSSWAVQLRLSEHLIRSNQWLAGEMQLATLRVRDEPAIGGAATALLGRLTALAGQNDNAAAYYRQLVQRWPDAVCLDGKTGKQLFDEAHAREGLAAALESPAGWKWGRVKNQETLQGLGRQTYRRVYPVPLTRVDGALARVGSLFFDAGVGSALARDRQGKSLFPVKFTSGLTFYSQQPGMSQAAGCGNLLIVTVADQIAAVDGLRAALNEEEGVLWRESLTQAAPDLGPQQAKSMARYANNPLDPESPPLFYLADSSDRPIGRVGVVSRRGVLYQKVRTLVCADPLTGRVQWNRSDAPQGAELFGDDTYVFAVNSDNGEGSVFSAIDGRLIKKINVAGFQRRWVTWGRNVLTWEQAGDAVRLTLRDAERDAELWTETYASGSRGCRVGDDGIAVLQPDGQFVIRSLRDNRVFVQQKVRRETELGGIEVLVYPDQYLLCTTREQSGQSATPGGMVLEQIRGHLYAFDRRDGKAQWQVPAFIDDFTLPVGQPVESPALWFLRQYSGRAIESTPGAGIKVGVLCIDRRTGRVIAEKEGLQSQISVYEITSDRNAQTSSLSIPGFSVTLTFTDEAAPPEPPAQTGTASSRAEAQPGLVREIAESIRDALKSGKQADSPFDDDNSAAGPKTDVVIPPVQEKDPRPK